MISLFDSTALNVIEMVFFLPSQAFAENQRILQPLRPASESNEKKGEKKDEVKYQDREMKKSKA